MLRHPKAAAMALLLSLGLTAVGVAAAWQWLPHPLPAPAEADRQQLLRWLVTRDLAGEPVATRRALARRLEEEFGREVDWDATGRQLTDGQRRQLWQNVPWLLEPWLLDKVEGYFGLPDAQRPEYVDGVIDTIASWRGAETLRPADSDQQSPALMTMVAQRFEAIKGDLEPDRRGQMDQFLLAVQTRWFVRMFGGSGN